MALPGQAQVPSTVRAGDGDLMAGDAWPYGRTPLPDRTTAAPPFAAFGFRRHAPKGGGGHDQAQRERDGACPVGKGVQRWHPFAVKANAEWQEQRRVAKTY